MPLTLQHLANFVLIEKPALSLSQAPDPVITHRPSDPQKTIDGNTAGNPITKVYSEDILLSSNPINRDLEALTDSLGDALDVTGLKLQFAYFRTPSSNHAANFVTIKAATVDGFALFGASGLVILPPGAYLMLSSPEGTADVATGNAHIEFVTTTATNRIKVVLVFG